MRVIYLKHIAVWHTEMSNILTIISRKIGHFSKYPHCTQDFLFNDCHACLLETYTACMYQSECMWVSGKIK